ncbi:hypothetical protein [Pseudomonas sp. WAC2]|uniref:hypothetical protein n=2 Tax=Pseudomonas TaxID=286 RepID=UPI0025B1FC65|nr:hypothetical protein [Pseudomonas sp. WAC2]MDN3237961.1 hypothetical protein [Pseudomonas sp. WAC2]
MKNRYRHWINVMMTNAKRHECVWFEVTEGLFWPQAGELPVISAGARLACDSNQIEERQLDLNDATTKPV